MRIVFCHVLFVLLVLSACFTSAFAETWYIKPDSTGDAMTIQAGIDSAAVGDTVLLANGTYTDDGNRDVDYQGKAIIVCSESDDPDSCVIDCEGSLGDEHRGFYFHSGEGAGSVLRGVKITNGFAAFMTSVMDGGGVHCDNYSSPTITNCIFENNQGYVCYGGGIYCTGSSPTITQCIFNDNTGWSGGGIAVWNSSSIVITDCLFSENTADVNDGGGICVSNSTGNISHCNFYANDVSSYGGAIQFNGTAPSISYCMFLGNHADVGGGVGCYLSAPSIAYCTFVDNSAYLGHVVWCYDSSPSFANCIFYSNEGAVALCEGGCSITLTCCDIYGNAGGDWTGCIAGQYGINGNVSVDPLFCDPGDTNFHLSSDSPCLVGECGRIGAYGAGCLGSRPWITSVADVGNDQGGQVRIKWVRSIYDAPGDTVDITGYGVYRREDQYLSAMSTDDEPMSGNHPVLRSPLLSGWDYIATVPARGDSIYQFVAPALCDSTVAEGICWSAFFVSAMTPDPLEYWDSAPDSGYAVDNLAPGVPEGFMVAYNEGNANRLNWDPSMDADFQCFRIYRGFDYDFEPAPGNLVHSTPDTAWVDTEYCGWNVYYKITALDFAGNESGAASPEFVTGDDVPPVAGTFALYQNIPNPFNPVTVIRFDLPRAVHVRLCVYDVRGGLVATLVDSRMTAGRKEVTWSAVNDHGIAVTSGVYFYRLAAGEFVQTRKMVLLQ